MNSLNKISLLDLLNLQELMIYWYKHVIWYDVRNNINYCPVIYVLK